MPPDRRPPRFPPPQFPPHRPKLFATTPPAIFQVVLGLLGSVLALRHAAVGIGVGMSLVEVLAGAVLALWTFAVLAMSVKILRRPLVVMQDIRPLPGRAGLAAASMSVMAAGSLVMPYQPLVAEGFLFAGLALHGLFLGLLVYSLRGQPTEARGVNPTLHLSFVGFILAAAPLAKLGWGQTAGVILWLTLVAAVAIWVLSVIDLLRHDPPAVLRPLLAIHLAPAALIAITALSLSLPGVSLAFAILSALLGVVLMTRVRWLTEAGFTPMWAAFTFPQAALSSALTLQEGMPPGPALALALVTLGVNGVIAWKVLKLWPGNRLAQKTNAAEA